MAVKLEVLGFWASGGRFRPEGLTHRNPSLTCSSKALSPGSTKEHVAFVLAQEPTSKTAVCLTEMCTFTRNGLTLDEIHFDVGPAGRAGPHRLVELFNRAGREGYFR